MIISAYAQHHLMTLFNRQFGIQRDRKTFWEIKTNMYLNTPINWYKYFAWGRVWKKAMQ